MTPMTPEALDASCELAAALGQGVRRDGRTFYVPSRSYPGTEYRVDIALDGALVCSCPASAHYLTCWHVKLIREEIEMTNPETSTALVPVKLAPTQTLVPSERTLALINQTAQLALSGAIALPKELNTREKVAAVMLYGLELGLKPMTSLRHIFIINGRPQPSAEVMAGLLISSEPDARLVVDELTETVCTMRILRPSRGINESYTVTWDEIKKAGLDKDVALKYPRDRLRWHCTKRLLRIYAPDAINAIELTMGDALSEPEEPDDADLYNDGDDRSRGQVIDGSVVERDPCTPTTRNAVQLAYMQVRDANAQGFALIRRELCERWPHVFLNTSNRLMALRSAAEAAEVLAFLNAQLGETQAAGANNPSPGNEAPHSAAPAPPEHGEAQEAAVSDSAESASPASPPACEHEAQYNEETTLLSCSKCGVALEEPEPSEATQPALT